MRADLRPSSLGEILDRTAQMYRSNFLLYIGIAGVAYAGVLILTVLVDLLLFPSMHAGPHAQSGFRVAAGGLTALLAFLPVTIAMAAVMHAVARNYLGQTCTIREAYTSICRRWYRYVFILVAIYTYGFLPLGMLISVFVVATTLAPAGSARIAAVILGTILVLAGLGFTIWWMLRWSLSIPASLMEDLPVHRALKRSITLSKGSVGRIFVMLLLVVAVMTVIQYAIQIPVLVLVFRSKGVITLTTQIVTSLGASFSGAFVLPIYSIAFTLFYYDQRIRKEGYDVEWLMEQAAMRSDGISAGATSPALPGSISPQTEPPGPAI
jgi:Membrane domain of glycerophosphoryl diester phosphodiesterase